MTRSRSPTRSRCSSPTCEGSSKPVASLDSSIRSAARATYSAYSRLPIRWRLAGGSAALTLVILCGFAAIVGVLTTRQIRDDFNAGVAKAAATLQDELKFRLVYDKRLNGSFKVDRGPELSDFAASQNAAIRVITVSDLVADATSGAPDFGPPIPGTSEVDGWRVETRPVEVIGYTDPLWVQYALALFQGGGDGDRAQVVLGLRVVGGAAPRR